ncbi:glycoside hydrolase family 5 protein [Lachnobacterium bovis]|uniref:glycoside hydrolase family 5 protein n=1 Tax=Lachnobacterium bovis TaxID=140626 RepID=UPI000689A684|nr:glycoside hydrolase family 5 protein [Lachnobacterium bovis]
MQNKKKKLTKLLVFLGIFVLGFVLVGCNGHKNKNSKVRSKGKTTSKKATKMKVYVDVNEKNNWESEGKKFTQYDFSIHNDENIDIANWEINLKKKDLKLEQNWNVNIEAKLDQYCLKPTNYNKVVSSKGVQQDIGIIFSTLSDEKVDVSFIEVTFSDGKNVIIRGLGNKNDSDKESGKDDSDNKTEKSAANKTEKKQIITNQGKTTVPTGRLHVQGTKLVDSTGKVVQLKGISTHGIAWFPDYINPDALKTLKEDWNANVFRIAMYTNEYGGYCNGGDKEKLKKLVEDGVKYVTDNGMYVIIDWHILSDSNPNTNKGEAIKFFDEMSKKYKDNENVLYEICNEPQNSDWNSVIKPYASDVVKTIRANDQNAVILVGTNTWSQDVDQVIGNQLEDKNVMYVLHFYAGTHHDNIRNKLTKAISSGVPVFVSECSITDASGNGAIDYDSANKWLSLLNENDISFIAWSLSNKDESSALIKPSCSKKSGWSDDDLSETGKWFKKAISGR